MNQIAWGPIVGVIVGFLLSQMAGLVSWFLSIRREKKLIRLLVSLEIDQNLALLGDYWHNVSLPPDDDEDDEEEKPKEKEHESDRLARRAVLIPLPVLSDTAFTSQLGALPKALKETEIRAAWRIYEELAQVRALHAWLVHVAGTPASSADSFPSASRAIRSEGLLSATFVTKKAGAIFDLKKTIQLLLSGGNPLGRSNPAVQGTLRDKAAQRP